MAGAIRLCGRGQRHTETLRAVTFIMTAVARAAAAELILLCRNESSRHSVARNAPKKNELELPPEIELVRR